MRAAMIDTSVMQKSYWWASQAWKTFHLVSY